MAASVRFVNSRSPGAEKIPLVSSPQGRLPLPTDEDYTGLPPLTVFRHTDEENVRKRNWRIVVAKGQKMDYVGRNHGDLAPRAASSSKYLIGVLDKRTGKMKAYDADLFNLQPWIEREGEKVVPTEKDAALSRREKTDRLIETFGSNKKKRAMHSRLRNKVSEESLQKAAMIAAEAAKDISLAIDAPLPDFDPMPPCNKDAAKPSQIYRLEDVLSESLMADLEKTAQSLLNATEDEIRKWKKEQSYPFYVLDHLPLSSGGRELSVKQKAVVLAYMHVLMQIVISRKRAINSFPVLSDIPHSVKEYIVNTFFQEISMPSGRTQRVMTKLSKNKIMIHLLILALHVDNFSTSLDSLQKDTGMAQKVMHQYVRSFGAKPVLVREKGKKDGALAGVVKHYRMELTAPLEIVTRKPMRQKKQRGR